jgi:hypothetical protein
MALTVARCYITEEPASVWQEHYGIVSVKKSKGETTKQQAYKIAQAKYPHVDFRKSGRAQKPHDGIVDAVLIARYCQSLFAPFQEAVIAIKRRCKFFDHCHFADETSRTCTQDGGGDYCGVYRASTFAQKLKEERRKEKRMKNDRCEKRDS